MTARLRAGTAATPRPCAGTIELSHACVDKATPLLTAALQKSNKEKEKQTKERGGGIRGGKEKDGIRGGGGGIRGRKEEEDESEEDEEEEKEKEMQTKEGEDDRGGGGIKGGGGGIRGRKEKEKEEEKEEEEESEEEVESEKEESEEEEEEESEEEENVPSKRQKVSVTKDVEVEVVELIEAPPPPSINSSKRKRGQPITTPKKKHGITTKKTPKKKLVVSADRPRNDAERDHLKLHPFIPKQPTMFAFVNFPKGRKKKSKGIVPPSVQLPSEKAPPSKSYCKVSKPASRGKYKSYDDKVYAGVMAEGLRVMMETGGDWPAALKAMQATTTANVVPRSTIISRYNKVIKDTLQANEKHDLDDEEEDDLHLFDRRVVIQEGSPNRSLTNESTRAYLQSVAKARDNNNRGMARKEMISFIAELHRATMKQAENHYDWLARQKKLPELTRHGRVVTAQVTTTNRTAITTEKLMRTHNTLKLGKFI